MLGVDKLDDLEKQTRGRIGTQPGAVIPAVAAWGQAMAQHPCDEQEAAESREPRLAEKCQDLPRNADSEGEELLAQMWN